MNCILDVSIFISVYYCEKKMVLLCVLIHFFKNYKCFCFTFIIEIHETQFYRTDNNTAQITNNKDTQNIMKWFEKLIEKNHRLCRNENEREHQNVAYHVSARRDFVGCSCSISAIEFFFMFININVYL